MSKRKINLRLPWFNGRGLLRLILSGHCSSSPLSARFSGHECIKTTLIIFSGIIFMTVIGCISKNTTETLRILKSIVQVVRIERNTRSEEVAFVFRPTDFKYAFVVHRMVVNPFEVIPKPFEVRGILEEKKQTMYKNFTGDNIGNYIKIFLNKKLVLETMVEKQVDYVSLGFYDHQEEAYNIAKEIVYEPLFEDLRPKELREQEKIKKELQLEKGEIWR